MLYLIIAIVCCIISGYLFKKASGTISLRSPNMMSVIFYFYFVLENVIGAVIIVNGIDDHYAIGKLSNDIYRSYGFWAIMYALICFPFGQLFANILFKRSDMYNAYNEYVGLPISDEAEGISKKVKVTLLILSCISLLAVLYTLVVIGGSPLKMLFSGADAFDMALARGDAKGNFGGNEYFRNVFGIQLTPFLSYVAYGYWKYSKERFDKLWFWTMLVASILILTYDLEKSPILWYVLGFVFFKVYRGYRFSNKMMLYLLGIMLVVLVILYKVLMDYETEALLLYNSGFIGRLTLSSNAGVFLTFDVFPANYPHLGFSSLSSVLSSIFDIPYSERSARFIMDFVNPSGIMNGTAGVFNSLFISEAWANWGLVGVLISPIYVGFIIQCLYLFLLSSRKTPFFLALFVYYTIRCSVNGGINDYIYNVSTLVMIFVYYLVYHFGIVKNKTT